MNNNIPSLIGGAAMLAAVGLTTGLAPASAAPPQSGANLSITQDEVDPVTVRLVVYGTFAMDGHDAHGFINNLGTGVYPDGRPRDPGGMRYEIVGDDSGSSDRGLGGYWFAGAHNEPAGHLYASDQGIQYRRVISVPKSVLNEDDGVFDPTDEVYVRAVFVDGDGGTREQFSNEVVNEF